MLSLLAPILAQLITLNLGARTEARYVAPSDSHFQGEERALVGLTFGWEHSDLVLTYTPSLLLAHLGSPPRETLLYQNFALTASHDVKRARFYVTEVAGYGKKDPTADALGGPQLRPAVAAGVDGSAGSVGTGTGTGTGVGAGTGTGVGTGLGTLPAVALHQVFLLESTTTSAGMLYRLSSRDSFASEASYSYSGGADAASRIQYPIFQAARLTLTWATLVTPADALSTLFASQYGWSEDRSQAWVNGVTEGYTHYVSLRAFVRVGIGFAVVHNVLPNQSSQNAFYPTADIAAGDAEPLARGTLSLGAGASFSPTIDPLTGQVDPRLTFLGGAGWERDRLSFNLGGNATVSLAGGSNEGSQDFLGAFFRAAYRLGQAAAVDAGIRGTWQAFQGQTVIPPTYALFVGITFAAPTRLSGG